MRQSSGTHAKQYSNLHSPANLSFSSIANSNGLNRSVGSDIASAIYGSTPQHTSIAMGMSSLSLRAPFASPGSIGVLPRQRPVSSLGT